MNKIGILLTHLGSPHSYSIQSIRKFLKQFLSDPCVIDYPRFLWLPILYGLILPKRPKHLSLEYQSIWKSGSPLHVIAQKQRQALNFFLDANYVVEVGMRYGCPCIKNALYQLQLKEVQRILIFPLYPQYSITSTGSIEKLVEQLKKELEIKTPIDLVDHYFDHPSYIQAVSQSILTSGFKKQANQRLLFSFHSLPKRYQKKDPLYQKQCLNTALLVAEQLELSPVHYQVAFQSQFGPEPWLEPKSSTIVKKLANSGVQEVFVVAPGFSIDCLETLSEIDKEMREIFLSSGGRHFHYIPALNDRVDFLGKIIQEKINHEA